MEQVKEQIFKAICEEYDNVYQQVVNGASIEVPVGENKTKRVFPVKGNGNWGLCGTKVRKDGRLGDTTTKKRLEILAELGLFRKEDFQNFIGNLHKRVKYNDTDAKYIMLFLCNRALKKNPNLFVEIDKVITDDEDFGFEKVLDNSNNLVEGGLRQVMINRFERDRRIRDAYIKANNGVCKCAICGFDFESFYGDLGKGFIHMHHMKPLSEIRQEQQTKFEDLILVCPNCHAMLHRAKPMLTPEQLKKRTNDNCKDNDA